MPKPERLIRTPNTHSLGGDIVQETFVDNTDEPTIMGRTYHKLSVGRESFEIDTRLVPLLLRCALKVGKLNACKPNHNSICYSVAHLLCRYKNLKPIGDGSYGFVCSADDEVSLRMVAVDLPLDRGMQ